MLSEIGFKGQAGRYYPSLSILTRPTAFAYNLCDRPSIELATTPFLSTYMPSSLAVSLQYLLPKQALTVAAGAFASARAGWLTTAAVRAFISYYKVNMAEAEKPDPSSYPTFNAFFTRAMRPGVRAVTAADWVCPVDGIVSQFGAIEGDQIFQAKGHHYSTTALLGGDKALAHRFQNGQFATVYLSPRHYHRIHMPTTGRLVRMVHVPGNLFSVNPATVRGVPGLFARNERLVCVFESAQGPFVMVLVGATIVGSMATVWHGLVNPPRTGVLRDWDYPDGQVLLEKGEEMGRFQLGSTVVVLMPKGDWRFSPTWESGGEVLLGQTMAEHRSQVPIAL